MADILVIDDDEQYPLMLAKTLKQHNHDVIITHDGREALKILHEKRFDLIIMDVFMPEMDGFEFLANIKHTNFQVPIIAISGGCHGIDGESMLSIIAKLGVRATLEKPFSDEQLFEAMNVALNLKMLV